MDEETQSQLEELRRERTAHARRLGKLREQRANFGPLAVPPYIATDIDDANRSIGQIDEAIGKLQAKSFRIDQQHTMYTGFNLLHQDAQADERRRRARQRLQDLFYLAVFVMLALILYQVWT